MPKDEAGPDGAHPGTPPPSEGSTRSLRGLQTGGLLLSGMFLERIHGRITPHPAAPSVLAVLERLLRGLGASVVGMTLYAPDDVIVFHSGPLAQIEGLPADLRCFDDLVRHSAEGGQGLRIEGNDVEAWLAQAHAKRRSVPWRTFEVDLTDGRWLRVEEITFDDGWLLDIFTDVTRLKENEASLRSAHALAQAEANTDSLTGLPNRRAALQWADAALAEAGAAGTPLSLAIIDIDHFKAINDRFGHAAGDRVLVAFGQRAQAALRRADLVARLGGEEFLLLLPGAALGDAWRIIEGFRLSFTAGPVLEEPRLTCTFSAGVAAYEGQALTQLISAADGALYRAKRSGRNQVAVAPPQAEGPPAP